MHTLCHIDRQSLIDLGIVPDATGEWPLRSLLDHTHSTTTHQTLLAILSSPLSNTDEIVARQQLLRVLPSVDDAINWTHVHELTRRTAAYLDSNYIVVPSGAFDATLMLMRYKDIAKSVEAHVLAVDDLLEICAQFVNAIRACAGDQRFQRAVQAIDTILTTTIRDELRKARSESSKRRLALCLLDSRMRVDLRERLLELIGAVHTLDAYCSLSRTSLAPGFVTPAMTERHAPLVLESMFHPAVLRAQENTVDQQTERVLFVTGPNMSGKSTFLRAMGICVVFAHLGINVPARMATIPLCDRLISSLRREDSVTRGESTYLAEIRRVKHVVSAVANGEMVIALLDEVFRGTNVHDASDATLLLVRGLARAPVGVFAVSSHLVEVADVLTDSDRVGFWHLEVIPNEQHYRFTHKLVRGVSHVRLGMELLRTEGVTALLDRIGATPP
jgi:DNA mismatch repair protein MutS